MMDKKKRKFIGLAIAIEVLGALAFLFYKLFPKMKKCCEGMREKYFPKEPEGKK